MTSSGSSSKLRGVFINQPRAQCSIFESGHMVYKALLRSERYDLDYFELSPENAGALPAADFYLFNFHHATMAWLDTKSVASLPGKKITIVLEMLPGNPFVYVSPDHFDAYIVLDPTMDIGNPKVYGFPRPLEEPGVIPEYQDKDIPWIGSFGFSTPGKGFELVVDAVNREFERALVRINIPPGTFADNHAFRMHNMNYADYLTNLCKQVAKPGIEVEVSRLYMSKEELITWCSENTLNCFLYARNQPGLSATTDQCITTGRPLAVSANETFRHIHQYIRPYPEMSLREAMESSAPAVRQMRADWTPRSCSLRFEGVLSDLGLLEKDGQCASSKQLSRAPRRRVLILDTGSLSIGAELKRSKWVEVANKSKKIEVIRAVAKNQSQASEQIRKLAPDIVLRSSDLAGSSAESLEIFEAQIPPIIPLYCNELPIQEIPIIGGYNLGPDYSGCEQLIARVQSDCPQAHLLLYLPRDTKRDPSGSALSQFLARAEELVRSSGINIKVISETYDAAKLLELMSYCSLNALLAPNPDDLALIDFALATGRPIGVESKTWNQCLGSLSTHPSSVEQFTLSQLIEQGLAEYIPLLNDLSEARFIRHFESAMNTREKDLQEAVLRIGKQLNTTLDPALEADYRNAVEKLRSLTEQQLTAFTPDQVFRQAFLLQSIQEIMPTPGGRILAVSCHELPLLSALRQLGYQIEEVDPRINFDIDAFYQLSTTLLGHYDLILAPSAFENVEDEEILLAELGDLLAPGGTMLLTCPYTEHRTALRPGRRAYSAVDFRERFLPILQECRWADSPRWEAASPESAVHAALAIRKEPAL